MSGHLQSDIYKEEVEKTIIQAFGWSVIEFEAVLFHKFLIAAGPASVMTDDMFKKHLTRMHSKGFISPLEFQGRRAWKKLVINWDESLEVDESVEEKSKQIREEPIHEPIVVERLVTESRTVAKEIVKELEEKISPEWNEDMRESMARHAEEMRKALSASRRRLLRYVDSNLPDARTTIERILESKGEEVLLLSLRHIASS